MSMTDAPPPASLRGVAALMQASPDPFAVEVGLLVDYIGMLHEPPVCCDDCRDPDRDHSTPCLMHTNALAIAFAWQQRVIEERG